MKLLVQLGLAVETESGVEIVGKKARCHTDKEMQRFEQHQSSFIELCSLKFQKDDAIAHQPLQIHYDEQGENPISKWFNTASGNKNDSTFLFGKSIRNEEGVVGNFFGKWDLKFICFTNPVKKFKTEFEVIVVEDEEDVLEAVDAGTFSNILSLAAKSNAHDLPST